MLTISLEEMTERIRAAVSSAVKEKITNFKLVCLEEDKAGGPALVGKDKNLSEYAIALFEYQQPGTRDLKYAGVLIDDVHEWPLGVVLEEESMWIDETSCERCKTVQGPFYNEVRSRSLTQMKTPSGKTYIVLKIESGEAKGDRFHVKDERRQEACAV